MAYRYSITKGKVHSVNVLEENNILILMIKCNKMYNRMNEIIFQRRTV